MIMPVRRWSWHGAVALTLAISVGGAYGTALVITALSPQPLGDAGAAVLNTLGGVLVGSIGGWLGGSIVAQNDRRDTEPPPDHPSDSDERS